ncbi:LytR/AlgR family response regulator transcription factor [Mucilaginibacter sp. SJ]|uniref:LytR/AlgR family response regulator transcription factor n=1 Tax=Mucilaginibacter sp. SJ TaxID=3029053 RepID=UPI0023AA0D25|nr:LytTR family DNA-binding domain-containing protein [Mucilaginibacter sp. SJ]WEA02949.1 LytTR family DNA-binding domain-containing protein [Mucilaginibacter sp. SJ]
MKVINCIIVEDEPYAIDILSDFISKVPFINLTETFTNPIDALLYLKGSATDLIFLDINMPELSGIDLIKMLPKSTEIIITSAFSEFALAGFENNVLDYLLKPFAFDRFLQASQKALDKLILLSSNKPVPVIDLQPKPDSFYLKTDHGKIVRINFEDIIYIEGLKNYCSVFTENERHISLVSMKTLVDTLPQENFARTHKSYIIALKRIKAIDGNMVTFDKIKEKIPIGVTYRDSFFALLNNKMFK